MPFTHVQDYSQLLCLIMLHILEIMPSLNAQLYHILISLKNCKRLDTAHLNLVLCHHQQLIFMDPLPNFHTIALILVQSEMLQYMRLLQAYMIMLSITAPN